MKRNLLSAAALLVGASAFAQTPYLQKAEEPNRPNPRQTDLFIDAVLDEGETGEGNTSGAEAPGDILFQDDFGSGALPTGWTSNVISGPGNGWQYDNVGPEGPFSSAMDERIESPTEANGFLIVKSDLANGQNGSAVVDAELVSAPIDVAAVDGITLEFFHNFRYNGANAVYEVSIYAAGDYPTGTPLVTYDLLNDVAPNAGSPNPINETKLFANTVGINAIQIVWNHELPRYYACIDDVTVREAFPEELKLTNFWWNGKLDDSEHRVWYTNVPVTQMQAHEIQLGGEVSNRGISDQTNVLVNGTITGPGVNYDEDSEVKNLASATLDSFDIPMINQFPGGSDQLGTYTAMWTASSDQSVNEVDQTDNVETASWEATGNLYSRDKDDLSFLNQREEGEILAPVFDFPAADEITGVECFFGSTQGGGSSEGAVVSMYLYNLTTDGFQAPITVLDFHTISAAEDGTFTTFNINPPVSVPAGTEWAIGLETITAVPGDPGGPWIAFDNDTRPAPFQVYECIDCQFGTAGSGTWFFRNFSGLPYIRLKTRPGGSVCDGVNLSVIPGTGEIIYDLNNFTASISNATIVGGAAPYSFFWEGPNPVGGTTGAGASDIDVQGTFTLNVTDNNGCTGSFDYVIDNTDQGNGPGNVGISELDLYGFGVNVYPNPNDGIFFLEIQSKESNNLVVDVTNLIGQRVYTQSIAVSSGLTRESIDLSTLGAGTYLVNVHNGVGVQTEQIVVR